VPYYRLYHFSPVNGRIASFDELEIGDDAGATRFAEAKLDEHLMELWQERRMVLRFEPPHRTDASGQEPDASPS
jgi:hypothetical protein